MSANWPLARRNFVVSNSVALREYADALDQDRGHSKSMVTTIMRDAADEIERLRTALEQIRELTVEVGDSVEAATRASYIAIEALDG